MQGIGQGFESPRLQAGKDFGLRAKGERLTAKDRLDSGAAGGRLAGAVKSRLSKEREARLSSVVNGSELNS